MRQRETVLQARRTVEHSEHFGFEDTRMSLIARLLSECITVIEQVHRECSDPKCLDSGKEIINIIEPVWSDIMRLKHMYKSSFRRGCQLWNTAMKDTEDVMRAFRACFPESYVRKCNSGYKKLLTQNLQSTSQNLLDAWCEDFSSDFSVDDLHVWNFYRRMVLMMSRFGDGDECLKLLSSHKHKYIKPLKEKRKIDTVRKHDTLDSKPLVLPEKRVKSVRFDSTVIAPIAGNGQVTFTTPLPSRDNMESIGNSDDACLSILPTKTDPLCDSGIPTTSCDDNCVIKEESPEEETLVTALADYIRRLDGVSRFKEEQIPVLQSNTGSGRVSDDEDLQGLRNIRDACAAIQSRLSSI